MKKQIVRLSLAILAIAGFNHQATAAVYEYTATAVSCTMTCNGFAALGAPGSDNATPSDLTGKISIDVGASDTFTFADVDAEGIAFLVANSAAEQEDALFAPDPDPRCDGLADGLLCNPTTAVPLPLNASIAVLRETATTPSMTFTTGGSTDANGELISGTLLFEFIVPPFNDNGAWVIMDLATGITEVCILFPTVDCTTGATITIDFAGSFMQADTDGDGVPDSVDNCTTWANPAQTDTDEDGFGNSCDADFNNDCSANFVDLGEFKANIFSSVALYDLNGGPDGDPDGQVNFVDLGRLKATFFNQGANAGPGPSAAGPCIPGS